MHMTVHAALPDLVLCMILDVTHQALMTQRKPTPAYECEQDDLSGTTTVPQGCYEISMIARVQCVHGSLMMKAWASSMDMEH